MLSCLPSICLFICPSLQPSLVHLPPESCRALSINDLQATGLMWSCNNNTSIGPSARAIERSPPTAPWAGRQITWSNVVGCWVSPTCYPNHFLSLTPCGLIVTPSFVKKLDWKTQDPNPVGKLKVDPQVASGTERWMTETRHHQEWMPDKDSQNIFSLSSLGRRRNRVSRQSSKRHKP